MGRGDPLIVVVLGDDGQPVLDRGCGDQGVGELDHLLDAGRLAVGDEACPADHDGFADRNRVRRSR